MAIILNGVDIVCGIVAADVYVVRANTEMYWIAEGDR
jgi:uncharacterized membrane protein (DUF485 family)